MSRKNSITAGCGKIVIHDGYPPLKAALPPNESQRLETLRRYQILDTATEEVFDGITRLVAFICKTPIALISLVEEDRQWFKSAVGIGDVSQTSRDVSICAHAILQPDLFVVPDTQQDARFADNPLVTAPDGVRFYAGAPLKSSDGHALGTLCLLDRTPRELTPEQRDALKTLSQAVMALLDLRRANHAQLKVVHDFTNLALGIHGVTEELLEEASLSVPQRNDLQTILRAAERSIQLTRQLKASRTAALTPSPLLAINAVVMENAEMIRRFLPSNVVISTHLSDGEPTARIDAMPFEQILLNLIFNARDAMPQGGAITITTEAKGSRLRLSVQDTGQGIPADVLPNIFQPFFTTKKEGTGLGLATIQGIVQQYDGSVDVQSQVGIGTTFVVTLPLAVPSLAKDLSPELTAGSL
jgi:signal transduction histidine kinase